LRLPRGYFIHDFGYIFYTPLLVVFRYPTCLRVVASRMHFSVCKYTRLLLALGTKTSPAGMLAYSMFFAVPVILATSYCSQTFQSPGIPKDVTPFSKGFGITMSHVQLLALIKFQFHPRPARRLGLALVSGECAWDMIAK
jgi:hypothetical protein